MKKVIICCLLVLVTACVSNQPSKFYSISSMKNEDVKINNNRKLIIGVDSVLVPGYLQRPQIVTVKSNSEIDLSEFDRWAEPLSDALQRIIASDIGAVMKKSVVKPASINRRSFDYIVTIELNKLDGKFGDKVELEAWWTLTNKENKVVANESSKFEATLGNSYDDLVEKQSHLINLLSLEIAAKINKLK